MTRATMPPVSVIVEPCYELRWVGSEPIAQLVARTGARVGSVFITTDQAEAYANARVREALEQAARACESRIRTGDPGIDTTEVDIEAVACAAAIRALLPSTPAQLADKQ